MSVFPGDGAGIERVEQWFQAFAASRDPVLREQIVLAYLGLADRLADRYRSSRGTTRVDELSQRLGRSPTLAELAAHLDLTEEEALEALEAAGSRVDCSLDAPLDEAEDGSLADLVAAPTAQEELEDLLLLPALLARLPAVEREVVLLRFFSDLSQYEIAARVGCSQLHVSRLLRRAIARMRIQLLPS